MKLSSHTKKIIVSTVVLGALFFFVSETVNAQTDLHTSVIGNLVDASGSLPSEDPRMITIRIINWVLGVVGTVFLGFIIFGGFTWLTAAGNKEQVSKAQGILKDGIIGVLIIFMAVAISNLIFMFIMKS